MTGRPEHVAAEIAAAIHDPRNGLTAHVGATAHGNQVSLVAKQPGVDVMLSHGGTGIDLQPEWRDAIEPGEVDFLAQWLEAELGATYRIKAYD